VTRRADRTSRPLPAARLAWCLAALAAAFALPLAGCSRREQGRPRVAPREARVEDRGALLDLLPLASPQPDAASIETSFLGLRDDVRNAIVMRPPAALRFADVPLHAHAELHFACGVELQGPVATDSPPVVFVVSVENVRERREVLRTTVPVGAPGRNAWVDSAAPLDGLPSSPDRATVVLEVTGGAPGVLAAWAWPEVVSNGVPGAERSNVVRSRVVEDLLAAFPDAVVGLAPGGARPQRAVDAPGMSAWATGPAITVPPGATVRWRLALQPGDLLRYDVLVGRDPGIAPLEGHVGFAFDVQPTSGETATASRRPVHEQLVRTADVQPGLPWGRTLRGDVVLPVAAAGTWNVEVRGWGDGDLASMRVAFRTLEIVRRDERPRRTRDDPGRNIVLLVVDTLRADHVGAYGCARATSPVLDGLAGDAVVFTDVTAPAPTTLPATASLLTGVHPARHGVFGENRGRIASDVGTFAETAQEAGWTTAAWVANPLLAPGRGFERGFEEYVDVSFRDAGRIVPLVARWIAEHRDERFVLYVHFFDPHAPYAAPAPFYGMFDPAYRGRIDHDLWDTGRRPWATALAAAIAGGAPVDVRTALGDDATLAGDRVALGDTMLRRLVDLYDGEIRAWDTALAEILAALRSAGVWERTIVAVTGDHGEEFAEEGHLGHGHDLAAGVLAVPLIVAGGDLGLARRSTGPVSLVDVMPTLLERAGLPVPEGLDGRPLSGIESTGAAGPVIFSCTLSFVPSDEGRAGGRRTAVLARTATLEVLHFVADDRWVVRRRGDSAVTDTEPLDETRVAALRTAVLDYERRLLSVLAESGSGGPAPAREIDLLRALGYVRPVP
jgi:arylsulfatase